MRIGYKASAEQFGPLDLVDFAVRAEGVGLDSVWVSDHFQPWRHEGGHAPFAPAWIAAAGERTERVLLGTSVLTPAYRYNPAVIAQAFGTLGSLQPGRIVLGVGSGEALNEIVVDPGLQWPAFKERFARLRESVALIRALWTEDRVTFEGEYYSTLNATVYDRPEVPIAVYVAAGGPVVAKYAGRTGDGFICTSGKGMDLYADKLLPAVAEGAVAAGKDPATVDRMIEIKLSYAPTRDQALEDTRFWAPLSLTPEQKHGIDDPVEMARLADKLPIEDVARRWIVATTPEEVVDQVRPYLDLGFDHLVFHGPGHDQLDFLDRFGAEVAPALRAIGRDDHGGRAGRSSLTDTIDARV